MNREQKDQLKLFTWSLIVFVFLISTLDNIMQDNPSIGVMQFIFGLPALLIIRKIQLRLQH